MNYEYWSSLIIFTLSDVGTQIIINQQQLIFKWQPLFLISETYNDVLFFFMFVIKNCIRRNTLIVTYSLLTLFTVVDTLNRSFFEFLTIFFDKRVRKNNQNIKEKW